jgi:competence protein ComEC
MFFLNTVALSLGLALGAGLRFFPAVIAILCVLSLVPLLWCERRQYFTVSQGTGLWIALLAGLVYWSLFQWSGEGADILTKGGSGQRAWEGQIVEAVQHASHRDRLVIALDSAVGPQERVTVHGRIRLTWRDPGRSLHQGDRIRFVGALYEPSGTVNPGGFDYAGFLEQHGIDATGAVGGADAVEFLGPPSTVSWWGLWHRVDEWREGIRSAAEHSLHGAALGVFLGLVIGDEGRIPDEIRQGFMATGTVHILSISGSHLGLITLVLFFSVRWALRRLPPGWLERLPVWATPTRQACVLAWIGVCGYTLLAGPLVATTRSFVMVTVFLVAVWLGYPQHLLRALAFAALLILSHDPRALFDMSFQLSFLSVLTIGLIVRRREPDLDVDVDSVPVPPGRFSRLVRLRDLTTDSIRLSLAVTLATLPLVAFYFNQVSWLGVFANLWVVPVAGFLLVPLGLCAALGTILVGGESLAGGSLLQICLEPFIRGVMWMAKIPGAEWFVASPSVPVMVVYWICLTALVVSPVRWVKAVAGLLVFGCLTWWGCSPRLWEEGKFARVTFLDVGQGDATLIELPDGQTVVIDGGTTHETFDMGQRVVAPFLWNQGIRRVDHVIGTHPQLDHIGGLAWILRSFEVGTYWSNGVLRHEAFAARVEHVVSARHIPHVIAHTGMVIAEDRTCRLVVLNPPVEAPDPIATDSGSVLNNRSIVTRLDCGPHAFLLTADIEQEAIRRVNESAPARRVEVMKIPHHGSRGSLSPTWIETSRPQVAIVSVGGRNPYGHPAPSVLQAYADIGARVYRTDRDGAVSVLAAPDSQTVQVQLGADARLQHIQGPSWFSVEEQDNLVRLWSRWTHR